jgi:hypothetical protein
MDCCFRQFICSLVEGVSSMSAHPMPGDFMRFQAVFQGLPQVNISQLTTLSFPTPLAPVVSASLPLSTFSCLPESSKAAHPPGPGLGMHAPSV